MASLCAFLNLFFSKSWKLLKYEEFLPIENLFLPKLQALEVINFFRWISAVKFINYLANFGFTEQLFRHGASKVEVRRFLVEEAGSWGTYYYLECMPFLYVFGSFKNTVVARAEGQNPRVFRLANKRCDCSVRFLVYCKQYVGGTDDEVRFTECFRCTAVRLSSRISIP